MSTSLYATREEFMAWAKPRATDEEYGNLLEASYILSQIVNNAAADGDCELGWTATPQFAGVKWKRPELVSYHLDKKWPADRVHLKTMYSKFYQKFLRQSV